MSNILEQANIDTRTNLDNFLYAMKDAYCSFLNVKTTELEQYVEINLTYQEGKFCFDIDQGTKNHPNFPQFQTTGISTSEFDEFCNLLSAMLKNNQFPMVNAWIRDYAVDREYNAMDHVIKAGKAFNVAEKCIQNIRNDLKAIRTNILLDLGKYACCCVENE